MKINHRRKNKGKYLQGHDYSFLTYRARSRAGVQGMDHDGGHKGSAKDIREEKTLRRRQERRQLNRIDHE